MPFDMINYSLGSYAPEPKTANEKEKNKAQTEEQVQEKVHVSTSYIDLTQNEFYCQYYWLINKIRDAFLKTYGDSLNDVSKRAQIKHEGTTIIETLFEQNHLYTSPEHMREYEEMVYYDLFGLGVLEPILKNEAITEIMVVDHEKIFLEENGNPGLSPYKFPSFDNALGTVRKIIEPLNKRLNFSSPSVDAQLPDGSRLSASIPPVKADGSISITIRKFPKDVKSLELMHDLFGNASLEMDEFMANAVSDKTNMIASGGTGSGKTTLLNALSMHIPARERVLTCEDTKELQLIQEHVEPYLTVSANMEGKGAFTMQDIIVAALRKRPDRIIVGECRGGEIVEMLNAMNTGHDGSLSTIHANNPRDMIKRATTMILSNDSTKGLPQTAILQLLGSAVQIICQASRLQDGSRRIMNITEVLGPGYDGWKRLADKLGEMEVRKMYNYPEDISNMDFEYEGVSYGHGEEGFRDLSVHLGEPLCTKLYGNPKEDQMYMFDIFRFQQYGRNTEGEIVGWYESTGYWPYLLDKLIVDKKVFKDLSIYTKPTQLLEVTGKRSCGYERCRNTSLGVLPVKYNEAQQRYIVREKGDLEVANNYVPMDK